MLVDPGRRYLPPDLQRLATYRVQTSLELEDSAVKDAGVYAVPAARRGGGGPWRLAAPGPSSRLTRARS